MTQREETWVCAIYMDIVKAQFLDFKVSPIQMLKKKLLWPRRSIVLYFELPSFCWLMMCSHKSNKNLFVMY